MTAAAFAGVARVTTEELRVIAAFRDRVIETSKSFNLVGPSFAIDFWRRHALDSAQLFHVEQAPRWADVGSGAGFPGIILAILLKRRRGGRVELIESIGKRAQFLAAMCAEFDLPGTVHKTRAEDMPGRPKVDVVTARACAPLSRLLGYSAGFLQDGARGLFLKGGSAEGELATASQAWDFAADMQPSLSDPGGRIVRVTRFAGRHGR